MKKFFEKNFEGFMSGVCFLAIAGLAIGMFTRFQFSWLNIVTFICLLFCINRIIWGNLKSWKDEKIANYFLIVTAGVSLLLIAYVLDKGNLGLIPDAIICIGVTVYFGWVVWGIIFAFEGSSRIFAFFGICLVIFFSWLWFQNTIRINVNKFSDIAQMEIFESKSPPINKKEFIEMYGVPEDIYVETEYDDESSWDEEILEYLIDGEKMYVVFTDKDYEGGRIEYEPVNLEVASFLKDESRIRQNPFISYRIVIKNSEGQILEVSVNKKNFIYHISYH